MMGAEIKERRKAAGLTQEELGKAVGVTGSHICSIERGKHSAPPTLLAKITEILEAYPFEPKKEPPSVIKDEIVDPSGRKIVWVFGLPEKR